MAPEYDSNLVGHRVGGGAQVPDRELIEANQPARAWPSPTCQYFHWKINGSYRNNCISIGNTRILAYPDPWRGSWDPGACMHICMYVCMSVCLSVCMYACMYACDVCMHAMHVCMCACDVIFDCFVKPMEHSNAMTYHWC